MPAFNASGTIAAQIEAILNQRWPAGWELVVADNGSSDDTRAVVEALAQRDSRVRLVLADERRGPSHARNVGASFAHGRAVAFCDADDVVTPGWLAAMGEALRRSPAVTGPQEQQLLNPEWRQNVYGSGIAASAQRFEGVFPYGASANLGVVKEVFDELGGFDESISVGEDLDLCMRLWHKGHDLAFIPDAKVHYRNRATLGDLWKQSVAYGAAGPMIIRRLVDLGHPVPHRLRGLKNWVWLLRSLPTLRSRAGRARWLVVAGGAAGRLIGSVRHRTLYC